MVASIIVTAPYEHILRPRMANPEVHVSILGIDSSENGPPLPPSQTFFRFRLLLMTSVVSLHSENGYYDIGISGIDDPAFTDSHISLALLVLRVICMTHCRHPVYG